MINAYTNLVVDPGGKQPLGTPRGRWEDNIKMNIREIVCVDVDWIHLALDRWWTVVNTVMNVHVP
jgi:hypothetical protein